MNTHEYALRPKARQWPEPSLFVVWHRNTKQTCGSMFDVVYDLTSKNYDAIHSKFVEGCRIMSSYGKRALVGMGWLT